MINVNNNAETYNFYIHYTMFIVTSSSIHKTLRIIYNDSIGTPVIAFVFHNCELLY